MRLKIGEFAKLSMVSVSALRYYDDVGLLRPAEIDRWTAYRYYAVAQLPLLYRILALKDLGLSLEQIRQLLNDALSAEQIAVMLRVKHAELQGQAGEIRERLARIDTRLLQIAMEGKMPDYAVVVKRVGPIRAAILRDTVPNMEAVNQTFNRLFDEAMAHVTQNGGSIDGPPFDMWLANPAERPADIPVAVAIPTNGDIPGTARIKVEELPAVERMAAVIHHGPFATLSQAYVAVDRWIQDSNYHISGPSREIYLQYERDGDPNEYVTELQFPVEMNR